MTSTFRNNSKIGQIFSENIDDLIFILNDKYQCEYNNFQQSNYKRKINDYVHPQDFKRVSKLLKDIFKTGYGSEDAQIKYDGKPFRWFEIKGKSFIDSEDNSKKAFLICRDITKFKKFEFDLKESQTRFGELTDSLPEIQFWRLLQSRKGINVVQQTTEMLELVVDNIPQLIYWKDTNLVYMGCNKNFALLNNIEEPTIIIGRKDEDLIWYKENLQSLKNKEHEVIRNDKPEYNVIESLNFVKGKQSWYEINRIPLHDSKGNVVGILVTYEDITIRKIGEQKLKESEEKYRGILENIKETYFEVDLKGNFTFFNDAFIDLIGYSKSELLGTNYRNFVDEENKNKILRVYNEVYQTSQPKSNFQYQFRKKNGDLVICESSVYLIYDSEGNKIGFSGLARDITEKFI
ncbi:MAG: PAS domain S-box protein, partial [Candidatus Lokiarchaeota archaeon]|nr:PAS domain S-box protein [Candidatus Lokiarchaeota archaeon]